MQRKSVALSIKTADDEAGTFAGLASVSTTSTPTATSSAAVRSPEFIATGQPIPLIWEHKADDPRNYVGDVIEATETAEGLAIVGKFDRSTEPGRVRQRQGPSGRRPVHRLHLVRNQTKTAAETN